MAVPLMVSACTASEEPTDGAGGAPAASSDDESFPEAPSIDEEPDLGPFTVVGKDIIDPSGNVFVPVGANVGPPLADADGAPVWFLTYQGDDITTHVDAVKAWGWNTLRLTSSCVGGDSTEFNASYGVEEELAAIDRVVEVYTAEGIVVIVDCHSLTGSDPAIGSEPYAKTTAFWEAAAARYQDNPYVWFNHLNEFSTGTEPVDITYWQGVVDDGYRLFQEAGAENLLVFDAPEFAQNIGVFDDPAVVDWSRGFCNTVWDWHSYGVVAGIVDISQPQEGEISGLVEQRLQSLAAAEIPVLIGEIGYDWDADRKESNSVSWEVERDGSLAALEFAPAYGYGLLAWHANGDSGDAMRYGLKASDSLIFSEPTPDAELSELGMAFWEHSQSQSQAPVQPAPGGDVCERSPANSVS